MGDSGNIVSVMLSCLKDQIEEMAQNGRDL